MTTYDEIERERRARELYAPLTYDELDAERDRLARELYEAQCVIDDLNNEITTLRNPTAQTTPVTFEHIVTTTTAATHTIVRCLCGGVSGTHKLGCPQLKVMNINTD